MNVLDQKILEMKREGMSLRGIAQVVGLTHEGVRKRLMALLHQNRVSTNLENQFTPTLCMSYLLPLKRIRKVKCGSMRLVS